MLPSFRNIDKITWYDFIEIGKQFKEQIEAVKQIKIQL